jgi:hypothetical protein
MRAGFRARFCEFDDGLAAERVVRTLMLGERTGHPAAAAAPVPAQAGHDVLASS